VSGEAERFWKYVDKTENCWNWTGGTAGAGYGQFYVTPRFRLYAHRWAYEAERGLIPVGLEIDHLCRNRLCVNPAHLEAVTHAENQRRTTGVKHGPYDVGTRCRHGHERTPENTRIRASDGARLCIPCARVATKQHRERRLSTRSPSRTPDGGLPTEGVIPIAYNNLSRTNVQAQIPEVVSNDLLAGLTNQSAALSLFRQTRMATNQTRMPVLSALPTAYFVNGDTGLKQTTEVAWANKFLNVEELAAIVPIPEAVLDDAGFDVWGAVTPLLTDAIARTIDAAVFFGTNKPASWGGAIVTDATTAGNVVNRSVGTPRTDKAGLAGYFSDALAQVEGDGFDANGVGRQHHLQGDAAQHPRRQRQPAGRGLPDRHLRRPDHLPDARPVARCGRRCCGGRRR
jgi:hypothetical protein